MSRGIDQDRPCTKERPAPRGGTRDGAGQRDRVIASSALFGPTRKLAIRHGAELYTLRITRADKLLLTK